MGELCSTFNLISIDSYCMSIASLHGGSSHAAIFEQVSQLIIFVDFVIAKFLYSIVVIIDHTCTLVRSMYQKSFVLQKIKDRM
jgi:hypothetical protein